MPLQHNYFGFWLLAGLVAAAIVAAQDATGSEQNNLWTTYTATTTVKISDAGSLKQITELNLANEQLSQYGPSFTGLSVEVTPETTSRLHVKIQPSSAKRWEVPDSIVPRPNAEMMLTTEDLLYEVNEVAGGSPFALTVKRRSTGDIIFDTTGSRILFKDQYLELSTSVPADADLYGLGEVTLPTGFLLPRNGRTITLWTKDVASAEPYTNLYGAHPFYLQVNQDGSSHGVLLLNSNGMDVTLQEEKLTYKVLGGLLDFYFFLGPSPEAVIQQYHQVIGTPAMPPYWSLGLHQTKWGYANISVAEAVVANYSAAGLPLEVFWSDIDYQNNRFRSMEFDPVRYPPGQMRAFVDRMATNGQHWMCLVNPGIAVAKGFRAFEEGTREGIFIKDYQGNDYVGQVWPGMSVYPDYLANPKSVTWLERQLGIFHQQVPFSGLWLDMNEASNFCAGTVCRADPANKTAMYWLTLPTPVDGNVGALAAGLTNCQMKCEQAAPTNRIANPPFRMNGGDISHKSISPTAVHADGTLEYDAHNLFGTAMGKAHYQAVLAVTGKRPFLLSRSTSPGAGRYVAHWTGDNAANWENMYWSIAGILNTNLWGISMVGADICGFIDIKHQTTPDDPSTVVHALNDAEFQQLCNRWASAGAFYPFARNHMAWDARSHEFYRWPDVTAAAKKAFSLRYRLLTYLYGSLFVAHTNGGTVARPLLFTDPTDRLARNATQQWLLGEAVLVSPVLTKDTTTITPHFTKGTWYSAWDYTPLTVSQGQAVELSVPLGDIAVHYRGGSIIPMQQYAPVTRALRFSPLTLVVALPSTTANEAGGVVPPYALESSCRAAYAEYAQAKVSCGLLFMDSPADEPVISQDNTIQVWYVAVTAPDGTSGWVRSMVAANAGEAKDQLRIREMHFLGVSGAGQQGEPQVNMAPYSTVPAGLSTEVDTVAGALKISGLDLDAAQPFVLHWSVRSVVG